jgi:adenosine deaminase
MEDFIHRLPKAELHLHIEGSLEPEMMFEIGQRNGVNLRYPSVQEVRKAYQFSNLQSFLDIYYEGARVLLKGQDFYDLAWAYFQKAHSQTVRHAEIFFDPQSHTERGVAFDTVMQGLHRAQIDAREKLGMTSKLILCFLRHLSSEQGMETLKQAIPYKNWITAVGLDSSEMGHPPEKFVKVFDEARRQGFLTVAHAGEEGPPEYIWQALDVLKVKRIDHGVRCVEDAKLVERLAAEQIGLTVCPLSNIKLRVFNAIEDHNIKKLLDLNLAVTVNSDDPAYFGGYIEENFLAIQKGLNLSEKDLVKMAKNAFRCSFLNENEKQNLINEVEGMSNG